MNFNAYAGQRVLYKTNTTNWRTGELALEGAHLREDGLFYDIIDEETGEVITARPDNIFFNSRELEPWETDEDYGTLYEKEAFIAKISEEELTEADGDAYMSDGEYQYYVVPRLNENWISKQPFDYVVWVN